MTVAHYKSPFFFVCANKSCGRRMNQNIKLGVSRYCKKCKKNMKKRLTRKAIRID